MVDPTEQADFFWRVCLPIALLAMVLFGLGSTPFQRTVEKG